MRKWLLPVAASASLLLAMLAAALWIFSYDGHNSLLRTRFLPSDPASLRRDPTRRAIRATEVIAVVDGELIIGSSQTPASNVRPSSGWHVFTLPSRNLIGEDVFLHRLGLDLSTRSTPQGKSTRLLLPMWAVVGLTMIIPACWYHRWSRGRESRSGLCTACGHDLANLDGSGCPNCGTPIMRSAHTPFATTGIAR